MSTSPFGPYEIEISYTFLVVSTVLLNIVLLNLLISIIGDTFGRIKGNYNVIMYKDMLHMIIENRFLALGGLPKYLRQRHLLMIVPEQDEDFQQRELNDRLTGIEKVLRDNIRR